MDAFAGFVTDVIAALVTVCFFGTVLYGVWHFLTHMPPPDPR